MLSQRLSLHYLMAHHEGMPCSFGCFFFIISKMVIIKSDGSAGSLYVSTADSWIEVWRPPSEQNHRPLGAPALITGDENEGWIHATWFKWPSFDFFFFFYHSRGTDRISNMSVSAGKKMCMKSGTVRLDSGLLVEINQIWIRYLLICLRSEQTDQIFLYIRGANRLHSVSL